MFWRRKWPWVGQQTWEDIVFLHWPVPQDQLQPYIPEPLKIDQYESSAWISIVFFKANQSRLRSFAPRFSYKPFYQLNVRTYVTFGEEPGVYFFTLDANRSLVVQGGNFLSLPYMKANINRTINYEQRLFTSIRTEDSAPVSSFTAQYTPQYTPFIAQKGTLAHWLTDRYCIWMVNGRKIVKAPLTHLPWVLYDVEVSVNMQNLSPIPLSGKPLSHYAESMTTYAHPFEQFGIYCDGV